MGKKPEKPKMKAGDWKQKPDSIYDQMSMDSPDITVDFNGFDIFDLFEDKSQKIG